MEFEWIPPNHPWSDHIGGDYDAFVGGESHLSLTPAAPGSSHRWEDSDRDLVRAGVEAGFRCRPRREEASAAWPAAGGDFPCGDPTSWGLPAPHGVARREIGCTVRGPTGGEVTHGRGASGRAGSRHTYGHVRLRPGVLHIDRARRRPTTRCGAAPRCRAQAPRRGTADRVRSCADEGACARPWSSAHRDGDATGGGGARGALGCMAPARGRPRSRFAPAPGRVLHVVHKSLPWVQAGYTIRTQAIVETQRAAGLDPHVTTADGFPPPDEVGDHEVATLDARRRNTALEASLLTTATSRRSTSAPTGGSSKVGTSSSRCARPSSTPRRTSSTRRPPLHGAPPTTCPWCTRCGGSGLTRGWRDVTTPRDAVERAIPRTQDARDRGDAGGRCRRNAGRRDEGGDRRPRHRRRRRRRHPERCRRGSVRARSTRPTDWRLVGGSTTKTSPSDTSRRSPTTRASTC